MCRRRACGVLLSWPMVLFSTKSSAGLRGIHDVSQFAIDLKGKYHQTKCKAHFVWISFEVPLEKALRSASRTELGPGGAARRAAGLAAFLSVFTSFFC